MLSLPVLLLLIFVMGLWLVATSTVRIWLKLTAIALFCGFCAVFWVSLDSMLGFGAKGEYLPEVVTIRHVEIKEPSTLTTGGIFILIDQPVIKYESAVLAVFGYKVEQVEPRLYKVPYSRKLHEQLEKEVIPQLKKGQAVRGRIGKGGKPGGKGGPEGKEKNEGKGEGSESLEQDYKFYPLGPSYFQPKTEPEPSSTRGGA